MAFTMELATDGFTDAGACAGDEGMAAHEAASRSRSAKVCA
jgi:hypothetical protein